MSVIFVKSLFCPNDIYFKTTYDSVMNNLHYIISNNTSTNNESVKVNKIILIGWLSDIKYKNDIEMAIQIFSHFIHIEFVSWEKNYGKIKLFHYFNKIFINKNDIILYFDHDILFNLNNIKNPFTYLPQIRLIMFENNFSILALNQIEDCRHQASLIDIDAILKIHNLTIASSSIKIDVADGCFFIRSTIMETPKFFHVYGFDEKYLFSCIDGKCGLLLDISVIHPYDINDDKHIYKKWKIQYILNNLNSYDKKTYDEYEKDVNMMQF